MIVRGRAILEGPEPAQEVKLLLAKPLDVAEGLRTGQNRQQSQKQDFGERIIHLAGLTMVRQVLEVVKIIRRLGNRRELRPVLRHRRAPP